MMCDEFDWSWRASFFVVRYSKGGRSLSLSFFLCLLLGQKGCACPPLSPRKQQKAQHETKRETSQKSLSLVSFFEVLFSNYYWNFLLLLRISNFLLFPISSIKSYIIGNAFARELRGREKTERWRCRRNKRRRRTRRFFSRRSWWTSA